MEKTNFTTSISEQIKKLAEGVDLLSNELQSQVRQQHGALLSQARHAGKLSSALDIIDTHMSALQSGAERLKAQINTPYTMLENQTRVLARLHDASHLLRRTGIFLQFFRKLQAATNDPSTQATVLFDMEPLLDDKQLAEVKFIENERATAMTTKQRLVSLTNRELLKEIKNDSDANRSKVVNALQIFANLQTLSKYVDDLLQTFISDIKHSLKECFAGVDVSKLRANESQSSKEKNARGGKSRGPGKTPTLTTSQHFRVKFWTAIEWLFNEEIYNYWKQLCVLEKCLEDVRQSPVASENFQSANIKQRFWNDLESLLRTSFANSASHISQCLKQDLPKLLGSVRLLQNKIGNKFTFSENVFESLDSGYLEKCAMNLKAPLAGTDMPTSTAVDSFIQAAQIELSAAMIDDRLSLLVAAAFTAVNKDFWTKIEAHVKLGTDSKQVVGEFDDYIFTLNIYSLNFVSDVPNAAQIQNITLANTVFYHSVMVRKMIQNLGNTFASSLAAQKITESLSHGTKLNKTIIHQLIESIEAAVNIILLSMHREPGLNSDRPISSGPSLYMKELQDFLARAWNLHVAPFNDKQIVESFGRNLAERCIELFVRNVAIIRPISTSGRQRLKSDCQHLETALSPIVCDLTQLGRPFRQLRSLSSLLVLTPDELTKQSIDSESPVSSFIILLLLFAHASHELASPHVAAGWTNEKIIAWLDDHRSNKERLELVTGALQKYRTIVRQRNVVQYDSIYPYISNFLEKVNKA